MKYKNKTIKKRADGRWWCRYYRNNKQISVYGKTQQECLKNLKIGLKTPMTKKTKYKFEQWTKKWLELYKIGKIKSTTLNDTKRLLETISELNQIELSKITSIKIQETINKITAGRKKEKIYTMLNDIFNKAYRNKLIKENPCENVVLPKRERKKTRALTLEEEQIFVKECKQYKQGVFYLICLYQGLRLGECAALTYQDIDFDKKTITINKAINEDGEDTPKTSNSIRIIPLFKRTEELIEKNKKGKIFNVSTRVIQNLINKISKKLNIKVHTHALRHTFATRCCEAGIPAKVCQKWLGHASIKITLDIYTHINDDFEMQNAAYFDTYFDTQKT